MASAPLLSSKIVHLIVGMSIVSGAIQPFTSGIKPINHNTLRVASERAEYYSLSVVERAMSVCIFEPKQLDIMRSS